MYLLILITHWLVLFQHIKNYDTGKDLIYNFYAN